MPIRKSWNEESYLAHGQHIFRGTYNAIVPRLGCHIHLSFTAPYTEKEERELEERSWLGDIPKVSQKQNPHSNLYWCQMYLTERRLKCFFISLVCAWRHHKKDFKFINIYFKGCCRFFPFLSLNINSDCHIGSTLPLYKDRIQPVKKKLQNLMKITETTFCNINYIYFK